MDFKLEICIDGIQSALNAQDAGATRVELCDNLSEGGTTPGFGTIVSVRNNTDIGVNVLIRPRAGDFLYTDAEFDIMRKEIESCKQCGADGVVIGILMPEGTIDHERTAELVRLARPMSVTFHRAFDMCINPLQALEDIIASGADRLLTSGQKNSAGEGSSLIRDLVRQAGNRIIVMPGGGISESNISSIAATGAKEFHLSARKIIESRMIFRKEDVRMGNSPGFNEFELKVADPEKIRNIVRILKNM